MPRNVNVFLKVRPAPEGSQNYLVANETATEVSVQDPFHRSAEPVAFHFDKVITGESSLHETFELSI